MQTQREVNEAAQVRIAYDEALALLDHPRAEDILKAGAHSECWMKTGAAMRCSMCTSCSRSTLRAATGTLSRRQNWCSKNGVLIVSYLVCRPRCTTWPMPTHCRPCPATGWEETTVLAAAMASNPDAFVTDLMAQNLALAGRCAAQPEVSALGCTEGQGALGAGGTHSGPGADLRARIAAGLALGELGDPRFVRRQGPYGAYLLPPLVDIPGGTYHIGSDEGLYEDEAPVHSVELQSFAMARIPG